MPLINSFSFEYMLQGDSREAPAATSQKRKPFNDDAITNGSSEDNGCSDVTNNKKKRVEGTALPSDSFPKLQDKYTLTDTVLGTGQFGTVRVCHDVRTGARLACKTMKRSHVAAQEEAELRNEVDMMERVQDHENVVQLRGVFPGEGEVHLVMDLCEGGELFDEVVARERFSEADSAHLFADVVRAAAFCHSKGVMHRDLKPENLILTRKLPCGVPLARLAAKGPLLKLADFGLSAAVAPGEKLRGMAGSPFYMAPEVLTGEYDAKADVWSLGVILYILLSGVPPFWHENDAELFQSIKEGHIDMSCAPWDSISGEAKSLVRSLMAQDPAHRPSPRQILASPWLVQHLAPQGPVHQAPYMSVSAVPAW